MPICQGKIVGFQLLIGFDMSSAQSHFNTNSLQKCLIMLTLQRQKAKPTKGHS